MNGKGDYSNDTPTRHAGTVALPAVGMGIAESGGAVKRPIEPCYLLFGARVSQLRDALGITQDELRVKVSLTRTSISNIEAGRQRVLLHDVDKFARAFGISPKNFMRGIWL